MKNKSFFLAYIFTTLFLGTSIQQYLNIELDAEGVIAQSHYIALPLLIITYLSNLKRIKFTNNEKKLFSLIVIFGSINILILKKSAGFSGFLNFIIEPIILLSLLRISDNRLQKTTRDLLIIFFIIECCVAIFESVTKVILFADIAAIDVMGKSLDMRAYSLHGHPLQNAFLVSTISAIILSSGMKTSKRYMLFFLGYMAIFAFNTRSSIYFLGGIFLINLYRDISNGKLNIRQKTILITAVIITVIYGISYIETHSLGSRITTGLTKDDDSSNARFILINIISSMNIPDLLFGVSSNYVISIMRHNSLIAIENSLVSMTFGYGLIFTLCFIILQYKELKSIKNSSFMFYSTIVLVFLLLNTNNALDTKCPIIPVLTLSLYLFKNEHIQNIKKSHRQNTKALLYQQ